MTRNTCSCDLSFPENHLSTYNMAAVDSNRWVLFEKIPGAQQMCTEHDRFFIYVAGAMNWKDDNKNFLHGWLYVKTEEKSLHIRLLCQDADRLGISENLLSSLYESYSGKTATVQLWELDLLHGGYKRAKTDHNLFQSQHLSMRFLLECLRV